MVKEDWRGFGVRLGRAVDRWPGGGQRAFAKALDAHAKREGLKIPTSYRTLVNYLNGVTRPSEAWVEAVAELTRGRPEYLLTGKGDERKDALPTGMQFKVTGDAKDRISTLVSLITNRYGDLPMTVKLMMLHFVNDYFADEVEGWAVEDLAKRRKEVERVVQTYYAPLFTTPGMREFEGNALAASLTASAYLQLAKSRPRISGGAHA